jgi:hypothetical protein
MGLDIRTLMRPRFAATLRDETGEWRDEPMEGDRYAHAITTNIDFPAHLDGRREGWYFGDDGESFPAGSYSGYNRVRADICRLALNVNPDQVWNDPERYRDEPIYPLINFTDCDGAVGPDTSRRLADALDALAPRFAEMGNEWSEQVAEHFRVAFRQAADTNGFVIFR